MPKKVKTLVADTSAFIKNAQLQDIGENVITIPEVVNEVTSKRQLRRLVVLPYDLQVKEADPEDVAFVTQFAKKTGDYPCLSATDLKVMALAYRLEKEQVGAGHLKTAPETHRSIELMDRSLTKPTDTVGFYQPKQGSEENDEEGDIEEEDEDEDVGCDTLSDSKEDRNNEVLEEKLCDDLKRGLDAKHWSEEEEEGDSSELGSDTEDDGAPDNNSVNPADVLRKVNSEDERESGISEEEGGTSGDDIDENDDRGWITPKNVVKAQRAMGGVDLEEKPTVVACLTTDFAMQNVLKQIGLTVVSLDGLVIRRLKTYILRCYACFKTTSLMTKSFCPNCGNKTLKRVAVTLDDDGQQRIHINFRRPLTSRGKRFSLPKPQGGKHAINPVLCEDQRIPQQRLTKLARSTNDPMEPDYIAGFSPFVMRDINSKSAMLGLHRKGEFKYWMRKNPNEVAKHRKKK